MGNDMFISKKQIKRILFSLIYFSGVSVCHFAQADIVLSATRIIYPQSLQNANIQLNNKGNKPLLAQVWLDDGRENTNPQELKVPFVLTPPVARIDPGRGQTVRISYTGKATPQDKESLFWFNVLEIPPKAKNADSQNQLQLAFRTRIKLFYRPATIKGDPAKAAQNLTWHLNQKAGETIIEAKNDSPFHISLNKALLKSGTSEYPIETEMVAPFSTAEFKIKGLPQKAESAKIIYSAINDYGGIIDTEKSVQ